MKLFSFLQKYFKRKKLLKKYELTDYKIMNDIHLMKLFEDDLDVQNYYIKNRLCEMRCYNRLLNGHMDSSKY